MAADRFADRQPRDAFLGEDSDTTPGRWHDVGIRVAYCSLSAATTMLEMLVHSSRARVRRAFLAIEATVSDSATVESLSLRALPSEWNRHPPTVWTREYGSAWARSGRSLALAVPSAVAPVEWNVVLNPQHQEMRLLTVERVERVRFDPRVVAAWGADVKA